MNALKAKIEKLEKKGTGKTGAGKVKPSAVEEPLSPTESIHSPIPALEAGPSKEKLRERGDNLKQMLAHAEEDDDDRVYLEQQLADVQGQLRERAPLSQRLEKAQKGIKDAEARVVRNRDYMARAKASFEAAEKNMAEAKKEMEEIRKEVAEDVDGAGSSSGSGLSSESERLLASSLQALGAIIQRASLNAGTTSFTSEEVMGLAGLFQQGEQSQQQPQQQQQ